MYDTSKTARTPSWCDRILYKSNPESQVSISEYTSLPCPLSDHRVRPLSPSSTSLTK